jgi:hypothetical protein
VPVAIAMHRDVLTRHHAWDNGRRCVVKPGTLASVISLSKRQTQLLNQAARELGLEVVVQRGRMLTQLGRWEAYDNGSRQRGPAVAGPIRPRRR